VAQIVWMVEVKKATRLLCTFISMVGLSNYNILYSVYFTIKTTRTSYTHQAGIFIIVQCHKIITAANWWRTLLKWEYPVHTYLIKC
jgi:hypothetical protein